MSEPHAVVKLLVARMESHPEEFERGLYHRWYDIIGEITEWGNEADKAALNAGLRDIRLDEAHEDALEELLNGPENRRKAVEEAEYERQLMIKQSQVLQQQLTQNYNQAQQYSQGALSSQLAGVSPTDFTPGLNAKTVTSRLPTLSDMESNGVLGALRKAFK